MNVGSIDINLATLENGNEQIEWHNVKEENISIHGVYFDTGAGLYMRVPDDVAERANPRLKPLVRMTSGGRARFVTDSPFIAIKATVPAFQPMPHMSITGSHGFSIYKNGIFQARTSPKFSDFIGRTDDPYNTPVSFAEKKPLFDTDGKGTVEIYFPHYGGVCDLYIGVAPGSVIEKADEYKYTKPLVFYGSSITQGACVSRPGNDYVSVIARRLNADYINLGFSGNGNAEPEMLEYICGIDASLFAFDYNYYASRTDRVLPPHYEIYRRIREAHPDTPILIYDKPGVDYEPDGYRAEAIRNTYERAVGEGDEKIAYLPAEALLGTRERDFAMVDHSHPNDFGAMCIADALYPLIKSLLEK